MTTIYSSYTISQKKAIMKWRESNSVNWNEYMKEYQKKNYSKNREKMLLQKQIWYEKKKSCDFNEECKRFRKILF